MQMYRSDCRHFRGDIPCRPHKTFGVTCDNCSHYEQRTGRILIIKLGATGDVLRTTPILAPLRERYPGHEIWWITLSPDAVPSTVQKRLPWTWETALTVTQTSFDVVICLDKDVEACALAQQVDARERYGFTLVDGLPAPVNNLAEHKYITGIFDSANKANTKSYPQELMELCGFEWSGQEYEYDEQGNLPETWELVLKGQKGPFVGLNTGCGDRWIAREWPQENWAKLIRLLKKDGVTVVLLGGPAEHERNIGLMATTGAFYAGLAPLKEFINIVGRCDVVVTTVTMALHAAIARRRQVVLMNNIFNRHEFELYGRGVIVEPPVTCTCFFQHDCTNPSYRCMSELTPDTLLEAVRSRLAVLRQA
ncbi:MAG TPA: glycosyltransferase family 9 protein [Bacteroidetes bacterium]|nr:glycosyltransferase family 9 protein [Bacteroidota bacterium]HRK05155.1 glycosyltransferase family 9 protein [Chlorobiota bacterium]